MLETRPWQMSGKHRFTHNFLTLMLRIANRSFHRGNLGEILLKARSESAAPHKTGREKWSFPPEEHNWPASREDIVKPQAACQEEGGLAGLAAEELARGWRGGCCAVRVIRVSSDPQHISLSPGELR